MLAPLAVSVTLPPLQNAEGAAGLTDIVGVGFTVIAVAPDVLEQPLAFVTVMV